MCVIMVIGLSFKKYVENYKIIFITSVLFVFVLFIINPVFSLFGGSLNLSYNLFFALPDDIVSSLLAILIMLFIYSILQTIIIFKVGNTYLRKNSSSTGIKSMRFFLRKAAAACVDMLKFNLKV